jgi:hypothetical protein
LCSETDGTFLIFAAGTGILCFVDFVAALAIQNLSGGNKDKFSVNVDLNNRKDIEENFKIKMFVSF